MAKEIQLTQGYTTIVDDDLYEELNKFNWNILKPNKTHKAFYARRATHKKEKFKSKSILMHKYIMYIKKEWNGIDKIYTDHKDQNGLNNRYSNLRMATQSQNTMNQKARKDNKSGIKNISICSDGRKKKFLLRIGIENKTKYRKYFDTIEEAIKIKNQKLIEIHGEFANLN